MLAADVGDICCELGKWLVCGRPWQDNAVLDFNYSADVDSNAKLGAATIGLAFKRIDEPTCASPNG